MLLAAIDERHRGTYDFIYLPIDFKARFPSFWINPFNIAVKCVDVHEKLKLLHKFYFPICMIDMTSIFNAE